MYLRKITALNTLFLFPILMVFFVYGLTLDGSGDGIHFYMLPDMNKLGELDVWIYLSEYNL